jgi:predicted transport protein
MAAPLAGRLNLKPDMRILLYNDPADAAAQLAPDLAGALQTQPAGGPYDAVLFFVATSEELAEIYPSVAHALKPGGMLWIAYPKTTSGVKSDLTRERGWGVVVDDGWQSVRQVSVDDVWSAVRYKKVANAEVRGSVDAQYSGAKAHLRPLYDAVAATIAALGPDVSEPYVRGAYVAWARRNHFVAVGPVGKRGVGVAFKIKGSPPSTRLEASSRIGGGAFTHLVTLTALEEIDDEFRSLLRSAYEASA